MATAPAQPNAGDQPSNATASLLRRNLPRLVAGLLLAVLVISGLALFSDVQSLGSAFRQFDWSLSVPVLLLTLGNYMLRWGKWEVYIRQARVPSMRLVTSALIFLAGFSMSLTPGKVGEVIKGVLVKRETGTPVSKTAAVIAAERITDGLAMLALAVIGLTQFSYGRPLVALTVGGAVAVILVLQRPDMMLALLARFEGNRLAGTVLVHAHHFLATSNVLLRPRLLTAAVAVGILSWGMECLALYLILIGLGLDASWHLLLIATFVLSVSSVFGAISMLPGGLGVAEASVTGMLLLLIDDATMTKGVAAAATLLVRFSTLWFGVLLGFAALALLRKTREPSTSGAVEFPAPSSTLGGSR